jgi:hypothetical protein
MKHRKLSEAFYGRLCGHHYRLLQDQLREVVEMWALLPLYLLPGSAEESEHKHTKNPYPPAPMRLEITALNDARSDPEEQRVSLETHGHRYESNGAEGLPAIQAQLFGWAEYVRAERGMVRRGDILEGPIHPGTCGHRSCRRIRDKGKTTIMESVGTIGSHLEWLAGDDLVETFTAELKAIYSTLRSMTGDPLPKPLGKCYVDINQDGKECRGPIWESSDGAGARCGDCGTTWTGAELIRLRLIIARQDREAS